MSVSGTGPRIIAVGGGKGGVGKSIVASNLAVALAESGIGVVLVDADLGSANQHTLLGIDRPGRSLQSFLAREVETLEDVAITTRVPGLRLVVGTGAVLNAANINHGQKQRLMRQLRRIDAEVVLVDVGAGTSHNVVDFFDVGDVRVVVVTPQLTSIQNAYAFLKAAVLRLFRHTAEESAELDKLEAAMTARETERVDEILRRVADSDASFAARLRDEVAGFDARLVGNQVSESQDFGVFQGVARMVRDFLGVPLTVAGHLRTTRAIHQSVNQRRPFLLSGLDDDNARSLRRLAAGLMHAPTSVAAPVPRGAAAVRAEGAPDPRDYLRQHPRFPVNWSAGLERDGRRAPARVVDVSVGGVAIETSQPLTDGERWTLVLEEPNLRLKVPTIVRHVGPSALRAGLAFESVGETADRIFAVARQQALARVSA